MRERMDYDDRYETWIDEGVFYLEGTGWRLEVDPIERIPDVLRSAGLECSRRLYRMTYEGRKPALDGDGVVAATGFEWG